MQSGTPQTARETIVAHFRRHYLGGAGTQYFDLLIAGYDAELESLERSVAGMKAELSRLATQKAENLPDGSREFVWHWPYKIQLNPPRLFLRDGDGWSRCDASDRNAAPPLEVLAEQFAALGREQGFAQKKERNDFCRQLAALEGDGRTEGADVEMAAVYDGGNDGGYEPHVRLYVRRGDRIDELTETHGHYHPTTGAALSQPSHRWTQLPPLPPIEPTKAGAEERKPATPALARHDWHTHRGHVSCERCGAPFSEVRNDQACGAQP